MYRHFLIIISVLAVTLAGCSRSTEPAPTPIATALPPTAGFRSRSGGVAASGVVAPARWTSLGSQTGGVVVEVLVEPGQEVVAYQTIARLDPTDLEHAVAQARAALAMAEAQLAAAQAGAAPDEIAAAEGAVVAARGGLTVAEAALSQAEIGAQIAQANLEQVEGAVAAAEAALAQAEGALEGSKADLAAAEARLAQAQAGAGEEDVSLAQLDIQAARVRLAQLQDSPDEKAVEIARLNWEIAKTSLWQAQLERDALQARPVPSYQKELANAAVGLAETSARIAELQYQQAQEGVSDEDVRLAQIAVSQAQARLTMDLVVSQAAVEAARASVQMTQAGKEAAQAALTQTEASLEAAQGQVELAEASVTAAQGQVEVAKGQLAQAEAQRARLQAGATAEELAILQAQVTQAEAALAQAESALARATLVAPFAGTVSEVHVRVGQIVMPGQTLIDLGDLSTLRAVTTDLSERDVVRVAVGQETTVFLEALGDEIPGRVVGIAPEATTVGGDVVYEVVVELAELPPELRWGMNVEVEIDTR